VDAGGGKRANEAEIVEEKGPKPGKWKGKTRGGGREKIGGRVREREGGGR